MGMSFVVQTQVLLPSRQGELEKLSRAIAEAKVNIHAVMVRDDVAGSTVRLVLDKPKVAREALEKRGIAVTESKLVAVLCPDQPGEFWNVSVILAAKNANIQYSYTAPRQIDGKVVVLMAVSGVPPEGAVEILRKAGYECVDHAAVIGFSTQTGPNTKNDDEKG